MIVQTLRLNTGQQIPAIGFGTWQILLNGRAKNAVIEALHAGYRLIDTAKIYGNERGVGDAVNESGIPREKIFVTTKLWTGDQGYESAKRAFKNSLDNLGLEYIDLYLIHWPGSDRRMDSWKALEEIYASGQARAIGVSNYTIAHLEELGSSNVVPAVNQVEFHPLVYEDQKDLLAYCKGKGIVVEAYSPLMRGGNLNAAIFREIGQQYGKTPAQIVLRWCIQHGTVPLPKTSHAERMHENLDVFNFELSDGEMEAINALSNGTRTTWDPTSVN
jgi:diketogulonate reductase-like aldo/keto reductase